MNERDFRDEIGCRARSLQRLMHPCCSRFLDEFNLFLFIKKSRTRSGKAETTMNVKIKAFTHFTSQLYTINLKDHRSVRALKYCVTCSVRAAGSRTPRLCGSACSCGTSKMMGSMYRDWQAQNHPGANISQTAFISRWLMSSKLYWCQIIFGLLLFVKKTDESLEFLGFLA